MISKILENRYYKAGTVYLTVEDLALHGEGLLKDVASDLLEAKARISELEGQVTMLSGPAREVLDHSDLAAAQYLATSENPMERQASAAIMKLANKLARVRSVLAEWVAPDTKGYALDKSDKAWLAAHMACTRDLEAALK